MIDWQQRFKDANLRALCLEREVARLKAVVEVHVACLQGAVDGRDSEPRSQCERQGHYPAPHHRLQDPDNVIGPVRCLVCGHEGDVDVDDVYVDEEVST